ncbi:MAG: protein kinase [Lentisphaeraceae bacterium]|nr:protein kinase [Lentisphaeraceae bacterium]
MNDNEISTASSLYDRMVDNLGDFIAKAREEEEKAEESLYMDLDSVEQRYSRGVLLAKGGMKEIYRVDDYMTARPVAKAVMKNLKSRKAVEQFIQEARITARLEHPNIMPVYDIGIDDKGQAFFTMKLIDGDNLGVILKKLKNNDEAYLKQYRLPKLLEIFTKTCDAVAYAHSKGVLHLDLKPDNIQVGGFGEVLVCDWGLARFNPDVMDEEEEPIKYLEGQLTLHGQVFGSPGFMSPEQVTKDREDLDHYSDIYSLGCLLYAILTYENAFPGEDIEVILDNQANGHFEIPSKRFPQKFIPPALEAVCLHAMAYTKSRRYSSAAQLKIEINSFINGFATSAENAGVWTHFTLFCRRHKGLVAFFMVLVAVSIVFTYIYIGQEKEKEEAKEELVIKEQEKREVRKENHDLFKLKNQLLQYSPSFFVALNHIKQRRFIEAEAAFKQVGADKVKPYIEACRLLTIGSTFDRLPEDDLVNLIKLLNMDSFTVVIEVLLKNEADYLTFEQRKDLARRLMHLLNPDCQNLKWIVQDLLGKVYINCAGSKNLVNISPLALFNATIVDLSDTEISEITALKDMPLVNLNLKKTKVRNLEPLENIPLENLDVSFTEVADLLPLISLPLQYLKIAGVQVKDLSLLSRIKTLKEVVLTKDEKEISFPEGVSVLLSE